MSEIRTVDSGQAIDWDTLEDISDNTAIVFQFKNNLDQVVADEVVTLRPDNQTLRLIVSVGFFVAAGAGAGTWFFRPIVTRPSGVFSSDYQRLDVGE